VLNNSLDEIIKIVIKKHIFERFMYFLCDFRVIFPANVWGPQTPEPPPEHNGVNKKYLFIFYGKEGLRETGKFNKKGVIAYTSFFI